MQKCIAKNVVNLCFVLKDSFKLEKRIQNPVKHLRWNFL